MNYDLLLKQFKKNACAEKIFRNFIIELHVGRKKNFESMKNKDEILNLYYQVYNRKSTMKSRNPDIKIYSDDFNRFKEIGKKKVAKYKSGKITSEEFKNWIKKQI